MIRLLGAVLLAAGCALLGFRAAAELGGRTRGLGALLSGLEMMERELMFNAMPLPQLMEQLAGRTQEPARSLFRRCGQELEGPDREPLSEIWARAVDACPQLGEQGTQILLPVGQVLGRYEAAQQQQGLRRAQEELKDLLARAEEERGRMGRVYRALGLSGGAFLVILLL